jgi:hypothetical protein
MMMVHNVLTAHLVIQASIQGWLDLPVRMTAFVSSSGLKVSKPEVSGSVTWGSWLMLKWCCDVEVGNAAAAAAAAAGGLGVICLLLLLVVASDLSVSSMDATMEHQAQS